MHLPRLLACLVLTVGILFVIANAVPFALQLRRGEQSLYAAYSTSLSRKPEEALRHYEASWSADPSNHDAAQMYAGELARAASVFLSRGGAVEDAESQFQRSLELMDAAGRYPMRAQSQRLRAEILNNMAKIELTRGNSAAAEQMTRDALAAVRAARHFVLEPPRNEIAFHSVAFEIALRDGNAADAMWVWRDLGRHRAYAEGMPTRPAQDFLNMCARMGDGAVAQVEARRQVLQNPGSRPWLGALALSRAMPGGERGVRLVVEELRARGLLMPDAEKLLQQP